MEATYSDELEVPLRSGAASPPTSSNYEKSGWSSTIRRGEWDAGLFACLDHKVPNCFMPWLCPCISLAQIATRIGIATFPKSVAFFVSLEALALVLSSVTSVLSGDLHDFVNHPNPWAVQLMSLQFYVFAVQCCAIWHLRQRTRRYFGIPGKCYGDCLVSFFCQCCAIAQNAAHVKSFTPGQCDFGAPDVLPGYAPSNV